MHFYEWVTAVYFLAFTILAFHRRLPPQRLALVIGFSVIAIWGVIGREIGRNWLSLALLPMAYWQAGQFVQSIDEKFQAWLNRFDRRLLSSLIPCALRALSPFSRGRLLLLSPLERGTAAEGGRGSVGPPLQNLVIAIFEFAYLMCYPFVPLGLMALYMMGSGRFAPEFWNVVLPPAFICYGTFPFVQTLPPRAIEGAGPAASGKTAIRRTNLLVLRYLSVQANTFPSGHVAASLAVALVLVRHETLVGLFFLIVAIAIAAGAFAGRYHYALDVLIGAALAVISFVLNYIRMR